MPSIVCSFAAITVASLFYAWRAHQIVHAQQHRQLRQRVAYMLWVMTQQVA